MQEEVKELEARKTRIEAELEEVNQLIQEKQNLLKPGAKKKTKKTKKEKASDTPKAAAASTVAAPSSMAEATAKPKTTAGTKASPASAQVADAVGTASGKKTLPMDEQLQKIAKVEPNVAFIIQRSTNSNTVVYAGQKTSSNELDSAKPMDVYWIMYEKSGAPREDLNMIERNTAYGVTYTPSKIRRGQFAAAIASLKDRDCTLLVDEHGNVQARTTINGKKNMIMRRVFVQMTSSWGIPSVDYIEIFGVDPETHAPVYEKKLNK